ncbi:hypothetical protein WS62_18075 [Burkholderia sp. ABCPW 14]|nr:hypothetical protein WS62_18075 [Burkholderia sp. ABCPW 14]
MRTRPTSGNSMIMNHYAHGYVLMPILNCLVRRGVFAAIRDRGCISLPELIESFGAVPGYFSIALRIGEAVGLVKCDDEVVEWVSDVPFNDELHKLDPALFALYSIDPVDYLTRTTVARCSFAIDQVECRWTGIGSDWLREFADGIVVIPILVGLNQLDRTTSPNLSEVDLRTLSNVAANEVQRLFELLGWANGVQSGMMRLTDIGRWVYRNALNYSLGLSYRKLLNRIDDLVFGDPKSIFERLDEFEGHVDRTLNVLASGSMHKTYFRAVSDTVVRLFQHERYDEQPAYIVDTGCGDGSLLAELYQRICQDSPRGRVLSSYPLTMIGVDYNDAALVATRQRLSEHAIPHLTLHGDVGDPANIRTALRDNGIDLTQPLLHVRSFLDHDRPYHAPVVSPNNPTFVPSSLHTTRAGAILSARDVQNSLIEHLTKWRHALGERDELIVLEVHALNARRAFESKHNSISLHFDPLQALTGQLLVSAKAFFYATAAAGLRTSELNRFPEREALTRISFQRMQPVAYRIRFATADDGPALADLAAVQLKLSLVNATMLVERRLHEFPEGQFVVETDDHSATICAVAYVNRINAAPSVPVLNDAIDLALGHALCLVDLHAASDALDYWNSVLIKFLGQLMLVDESYDRLIFSTDPQSASMMPRQHQPLERITASNPAILCFGNAAALVGTVDAGEGKTRLLWSLERHPPCVGTPTSINQLTATQARELLNQAIASVVPKSHAHTAQVASLLDFGLDSLEITRIVRHLNQYLKTKISVSDVFRNSHIDNFIELLVEHARDKLPAGRAHPTPKSACYPLSLSQEPMWIWFELIGDTSAYNVPRIEHFTGALNVDALSSALRHVMSRHQILRTHYTVIDGRPRQTVMPLDACPVPLRIVRAEQHGDEALRTLVDLEINRPLNLTIGETFRVLAVELEELTWVLAITMHHMVTDGSSIPIFWHELTESYKAALCDRLPQLPSLAKGQYHDWGQWQRMRLECGDMNGALAYWRKTLEQPLPPLDLPVDRPRPRQQTFNGHRIRFELPVAVTAALKMVARASGATPFAAITASWAVFLTRMSGQSEIIVGTPWANREHEMTEPLIGCFVNTLPLRIPVDADRSFQALTSRVRDITLEAIEHAEIPFHKIVETLQLGAPAGQLPVYQTMVALEEEQGWIRGDSLAGTERVETGQALYGIRDTSKFELSLSIREHRAPDGQSVLQGELAYNTDLFELQTIVRMRDRFMYLVEALTTDPDAALDAIETIPAAERNHLLVIGSGAAHAWPVHEGLLELIDAHADTQPDAIALEWENTTLSYAELRIRRLAMASHFAASGVTRGMRVGVELDRSPDLLLSILALMHVGATYVPIDPDLPAERRSYMIDDAEVHALITHTTDLVGKQGMVRIAPHLGVPTHLPPACRADDDAYILYTSGTSGKPKGVRITHRSLLNDIRHIIERQVSKDVLVRTLWSTRVAFDQSVEEMFPALCAGQTVVLVDHLLDPSWFERCVTFAVTTPSLFEHLLSHGVPTSLRTLVLGGEPVTMQLVDRIYAETQVETIYNSYGPTECTDQAAVCEITRTQRAVSIGKPISNTQLYVLDARQQLVPHGAYGELCVGGAGVSPGYLNREELNHDRFVPNPFGPGMLYRTGDKARWNTADNLECAGRLDAQLKINGVRIEPAELEITLRDAPGVTAVHVTARRNPHGETCLVAYVVGVALDIAALHTHCRNALPSWLVPAAIAEVEVLPVTTSGKIDTNGLPSPWATIEPSTASPEAHGDKPTTPAFLAALFGEVLRRDDVTHDTSFFLAGGHSLSAVELLGKLRERHGIKLRMRDFFSHDTPRKLLALTRELSGLQAPEMTSEPTRVEVEALAYNAIPPGGTRVVIIGAGVAGIMASLECARRNIPFVVVEKSPRTGGVWYDGCNQESRLQTTSSVYRLDHELSHSSVYPDRQDILAHFDTLINQHGLHARMRFNTEVLDIERDGTHGFQLTLSCGSDGQIDRLACDGVLVCTGKHRQPFVPMWATQDGQPRTIHASRLDDVDMNGSNVVIVGGGSYAIEALRIAHQRGARHVTLLARRSHWVLPTFADTILYSGIAEHSLEFSIDYAARIASLELWLIEYYRQQGIAHFIPAPENRAFDATISTSDEFFKLAQLDHIDLCVGEIASTQRGGVELCDGTHLDADLIIAATGYRNPCFHFLERLAPSGVKIYQGWMFAADPRIAFVGFLDMVKSATAVIPLNLELALRSMREPCYRPHPERVSSWLNNLPTDLLDNVKAHFRWLQQEQSTLDALATKHVQQDSSCFVAAIDGLICAQPDVAALVQDGTSLSYRALGDAVDALNVYLVAHGAKTVAACLPPDKDSLIVSLAALKTGMQTLLFDTDASGVFLNALEQESFDIVIAPSTLLTAYGVPQSPAQPGRLATLALGEPSDDPSLAALAWLNAVLDGSEPARTVPTLTPNPDDTRVTFFTSGSTGTPKGVEHTLRSLRAAVAGFGITLNGDHAPPSRTILLNHIPHLGGFMTAYATLANGGTLFVEPRFEPDMLIDAIRAHRPTHLVLFTSWLSTLCSHRNFAPGLLDSMRVIIGGEPVPAGLCRTLCRDSSVDLIGTFGITECGPLFVKHYRTDDQPDLGKPLPGVTIKVIPEDQAATTSVIGELWVRSPSMFVGYRSDPKRTADCFAESGWFRTRDLVTPIAENRVVQRGRASERIMGGFFAQDIEAALLAHPSVHEAYIGWYAEPGRPTHLRALVVPAREITAPSIDALEEQLRNLCPFELASVRVETVDHLPRHATGKLARPEAVPRNSALTIQGRSGRLRPRAIMFPGQGVQAIGMLNTYMGIRNCATLLEFAEDLTGMPLRAIYANGPSTLLARTDVCQIGIFIASLFEWRVALQRDSGLLDACEAMLGLSLGEYTALAAAGALTDADAIRLLHVRGRAMQYASHQSEQCMVSVRELSRETVMELMCTVSADTPVYLANDLSDRHAIVAGSKAGCVALTKRASQEGAICTPLTVAGAFHSPYMESAAAELDQVLRTLPLSTPKVPILCNVDAQFTTTPNQLLANLVKQIAHPVLLRQSLLRLKQSGFSSHDIYTCGPGRTLMGIIDESWDEHVRLPSC